MLISKLEKIKEETQEKQDIVSKLSMINECERDYEVIYYLYLFFFFVMQYLISMMKSSHF